MRPLLPYVRQLSPWQATGWPRQDHLPPLPPHCQQRVNILTPGGRGLSRLGWFPSPLSPANGGAREPPQRSPSPPQWALCGDGERRSRPFPSPLSGAERAPRPLGGRGRASLPSSLS